LASLRILLCRGKYTWTTPTNVFILNYKNEIHSRGQTREGEATLDVPENERYTVLLNQYKTGNLEPMKAHKGTQTLVFDLDDHRTQ